MKKVGICFCLVLILICSCSDSYLKNFKTDEPNNLPEGFLDLLEYKDGVISVAGWAADQEDGAPVERVMIYIDNKLLGKVTKMGIERPDVAKYFNNPNRLLSGWELKMKIPLSKGKHFAFAVGYDKMEGFTKMQENEFVVD